MSLKRRKRMLMKVIIIMAMRRGKRKDYDAEDARRERRC